MGHLLCLNGTAPVAPSWMPSTVVSCALAHFEILPFLVLPDTSSVQMSRPKPFSGGSQSHSLSA